MDITTSVGLIALFAGLTIFFTLYAIYAPVVKKDTNEGAIEQEIFGEQVETFEPDDSLGKYVRPVLNNFLPQLPKIKLSEERKHSLNNLIIKSGNVWRITAEEFVGLTIGLGILGLLLGSMLTLTGIIPAVVPPLIVIIFCGGALAALPYSTYNTRKQNRTKAIEKELPEALDLLTITIASGQVFEYALESVTKQLPDGLLRTEFGKVIVEMQAGSSLERSFNELSRKFESEDLESFTKAVIQATNLGSDVTDTLTQQAEFVRDNYEARLDRMIGRLETTILIPLTITMLPAFMLIFLAPVIQQLTAYLG